jgi:hypothetical protein
MCFVYCHAIVEIMVWCCVGGVLVQFFVDMIIVNCPTRMHVDGYMDGILSGPLECIQQKLLGTCFFDG